MQPARIVLDNKVIYHGSVFAHGNNCFGELIFNTSMSGYEEVLTDPSYKNQFVLMTYPLIGNYGINENNTSLIGGPSLGNIFSRSIYYFFIRLQF